MLFDAFDFVELLYQFLKSSIMIWKYIFSPKYRSEIKEKWESGKSAGIVTGFSISVICNLAAITLLVYLAASN